jgi:hypothetical protein
MVIWGSPYTGNVWAGPGHILDPEVQTLIRNFLQNSGRILFSGQDIAWALSLRGSFANQFMNDILRVSFDSDTADDVFLIPYRGLRHQLQGATPPAGEDPNPIASNPGGISSGYGIRAIRLCPTNRTSCACRTPRRMWCYAFDTFDVIRL